MRYTFATETTSTPWRPPSSRTPRSWPGDVVSSPSDDGSSAHQGERTVGDGVYIRCAELGRGKRETTHPAARLPHRHGSAERGHVKAAAFPQKNNPRPCDRWRRI
jgi:hypothetical protein